MELKTIDLERYCICPICNHIASTLVQHIHNTHSYTTEEFKLQFPNSPLQSEWFKNRTNSKNHLTETGRKSLSNRMKNNNPMKKIDIRRKVSDTIKEKYKTDENFREKMKKVREENVDNCVKTDKNGAFKISGWGVSGKFDKFYFRSTNELKFLIWAKKHSKIDKLEANIKISYEQEYFWCDFKLENVFYEIQDKEYAQDEREHKQFRLIEYMKRDGYIVKILTKKSDIIKAISYYDILDEWKNNNIQFAKNKEHYNLVKKLKSESA